MNLYRNPATGEIRNIDAALITAWQAAGNPKASLWEAYTPPDPPPAPADPRWVEFGAALAADGPVNRWFGGLFSLAPVLHGMITVGLGQAAQGDPRTFLAAWAQAVAAGLVPSALVVSVAAMAKTFDLPDDFTAALASA